MRRTFFLILASVISCFFLIRRGAVNAGLPFPATTAAMAPVARTANTAALLTSSNFEEHVNDLYRDIGLTNYQLDHDVFRLGLIGYYLLRKEGALNDKRLLTIIDFGKPSTAKRFYAIDLRRKEVRYFTYVAHGSNTGENFAKQFSNTPRSNQSSLGFYVTAETYVGSKGYSLRLDGKETCNDNIRSRAVVMHAADYATADWISRYGRLGRSQGCPALPPKLSRDVINLIKDKTAIFTYYPDADYLNTSPYLKVKDLFEKLDADPIPLAAAFHGRLGL